MKVSLSDLEVFGWNYQHRFTATRDYKFEYWKAYVIEIAKRLMKKGLDIQD